MKSEDIVHVFDMKIAQSCEKEVIGEIEGRACAGNEEECFLSTKTMITIMGWNENIPTEIET